MTKNIGSFVAGDVEDLWAATPYYGMKAFVGVLCSASLDGGLLFNEQIS